MAFIVYRLCATGVFEYVGYDDVSQICSISSIVAPNVPVFIAGRGFRYVSSFDINTTLVPGITRRSILTEPGNQIAGVLRWDGNGEYTLIFNHVQYHILGDSQKYILKSENGAVLLELRRISHDTPIPDHVLAQNSWYDITPMFELCTYASLPDVLISIFTALPMLEFGL